MDSAILVQNIKSYCKAKGIYPTVACAESGAGRAFISNIYKGQTPSIEKVQQLATYLGCTVSDLLGEKKEPTTEAAQRPDFLIKFDGLDLEDQQEVIAIIEMKSARKKK